jgi:hypothetical protein
MVEAGGRCEKCLQKSSKNRDSGRGYPRVIVNHLVLNRLHSHF